MRTLSVFCNPEVPPAAAALLRAGLGSHRLLVPEKGRIAFGGRGVPDPLLDGADVAFGQPDVGQVIASPRLLWVHVTSAGYTAYDRDDVRTALQARGGILTKSSLVYDDPCAEHLLAFMCANARQLPIAFASQRESRGWPKFPMRTASRLLQEQTIVIVGFGSIGRRLTELVAPLRMQVIALRRHRAGDEGVPTFTIDEPEAAQALARADHVVDTLPANASTEKYFDAARFSGLKRGAIFYNIGRGTTVDQEALGQALGSGLLSAAYLDVTEPEPLPSDHPLWRAPNCFITPHTAGGHDAEAERLVKHFLENFNRFTRGEAMLDRVF